MRDFIGRWTHGDDWRTWVAHSVLALLIFLPPAAVFGPAVGAAAAIGYYLIREPEQLLYGWAELTFDTDWVDHVLDVACPAAVTLAAAGLWGVA